MPGLLRYLRNCVMEWSGRDRCEGDVRWKEVERKQWRVEYRLESGVESDAESEQERSGNGSGLWSEGGLQSKVRVRQERGVKRGAKTGRTGKVGRRRLERKVECKAKWSWQPC